MATPEKKPFFTLQLLIDLVLCALFFAFFFKVLQNHVPSSDPTNLKFFAASGAGCMTGVFWMAMHMVRVVYRFQRASNR
jgi:ABC-type Co2+ transport system permease subunit